MSSGFCCLGGAKAGPSQLMKRFGEADTRAYYHAERAAVDHVAALLDRHGIEADTHSDGETLLAFRPKDIAVLDELARVFRRCPAARFEVGGHTDSDGSAEANQSLSEDRANAVRDYLVALGIPASRLGTISYGKERPAQPGSSEQYWSQNRRSMLVVN